MGQLIILMGPTGAGKSSQGDLLAKALGGVHLSSGNLLRQDPRTAPLLVSGALMPAAEAERVIAEAIDAVPESQPIVLDGFPRTESNVRWIDNQLLSHHRKLQAVVLLDVSKETVFKRLSMRDRSDDAPEAIERKWQEYEKWTHPVIEHYRDLGVLKVVDGSGSFDEVQNLVRAALV